MYRRDLTRIELKLEDVNDFSNQNELEQQFNNNASNDNKSQTSGQSGKPSGSPTTSSSSAVDATAVRHTRIGLRKNFLSSSSSGV